MKHSPIIQENLDKLETPKEKISYLLYAYKEWIISISIILIFTFSIAFSILFKEEANLTIRIVSDVPIAEQTLEGIKSQLNNQFEEPIAIDLNNFYSMDQFQVLTVQLVAQEIDFVVFPENLSDETFQLQIENVQEPSVFSLKQDELQFNFYKTFSKTENSFAEQVESKLTSR
ncbi:hypothetical protein [Globicatella sanguinis]|uniref:hypothetical protein n=1 Tax=Globicatella sanguinis TaxID=13076 RepID=UPI000C7A7AAC|nr:hypothetical protein [Globicatella sanguinis]MDK7631527.1 hypothetical protein [Globicatella sanguinis]WIK65811.1 hypothetical protein CYJ72_007730 [Globicatella sanguinis]WKT55216.1 hypothetical protein Q3C38_07730 [Globicatella sanguinis]